MIPIQFNYDADFRKRQIDTLKIFNDNVREVKENEEYTITFLSAGRVITITVMLGPNFPNDKPRIVVSPPIKHQWCNDSTGEVQNAPGLLNYTPHSDLGRIVQAIIREFEKFPPPLLNDNTSSININDMKNVYDHTVVQYPIIDPIIPELSKLSIDELKKLNCDPTFFEDFVEETSVLQTLHQELDAVMVQVESISKENQSKENCLNEMKTKLKNDFSVLKNLGEKYEKLSQQYQKKSEEFAPQHIRELLQIATSNAESECDKHVEEFLGEKIDVQTFLNRYTESKKLSAMRKAKEERLAHQLNAMEKARL